MHSGGAFSFEHFRLIAPTLLSYSNHLRGSGCFGLCFEGYASTVEMAFAFKHSLLSRGYDTVHAANRVNARSQDEFGNFHFNSAMRLDLLHGAPADDDVVASRWAEALRFTEMAAAQGVAGAQTRCGVIHATGGRSVPQNLATAELGHRREMVAQGSPSRRRGSRRCTGDGVLPKVRGARSSSGCPICATGHPGTGSSGCDCSFYAPSHPSSIIHASISI